MQSNDEIQEDIPQENIPAENGNVGLGGLKEPIACCREECRKDVHRQGRGL